MARTSIEDALKDPKILEILGPVKKKASTGQIDSWAILASDCLSFFQNQGRLPSPSGSISEKRLERRLSRALQDPEGRSAIAEIEDEAFRAALAGIDKEDEPVSIDEFLASDEAQKILSGGIFDLKHVKPRQPRDASEAGYIGRRTQCGDFETYRPIFDAVRDDVRTGAQEFIQIPKADHRDQTGVGSAVRRGNIFSLNGLLTYVAKIEESPHDDREASRLLLIFDNGTQSDVLLGSFTKSLRKDRRARWLRPASAGPLFNAEVRENYESLERGRGDYAPFTGNIYLLRSLSADEAISPYSNTLFKIGCTRGEIDRRISGAENQPTYLCSAVEAVAEYRLHGLDPFRVEKLLHRFFSEAQIDITLLDRWGNPYKPREWFIVSPDCVKQAIEAIGAGTLPGLVYDAERARIMPR